MNMVNIYLCTSLPRFIAERKKEQSIAPHSSELQRMSKYVRSWSLSPIWLVSHLFPRACTRVLFSRWIEAPLLKNLYAKIWANYFPCSICSSTLTHIFLSYCSHLSRGPMRSSSNLVGGRLFASPPLTSSVYTEMMPFSNIIVIKRHENSHQQTVA